MKVSNTNKSPGMHQYNPIQLVPTLLFDAGTPGDVKMRELTLRVNKLRSGVKKIKNEIEVLCYRKVNELKKNQGKDWHGSRKITAKIASLENRIAKSIDEINHLVSQMDQLGQQQIIGLSEIDEDGLYESLSPNLGIR